MVTRGEARAGHGDRSRHEVRDVHGDVIQAGRIDSVTGFGTPPLRPIEALPAVAECDPVRLGVHRAAQGDGASGITPYVTRDVDGELRDHVRRAARNGGMVLVVGHSTAGKSRSAYQAVVREIPGHRLLAPRAGEELRALFDSDWGQGTDWLLWLDDLEEHLGEKGLIPELLDELTDRRVPVVATMRSLYYHEVRAGTGTRGTIGPGDNLRQERSAAPGGTRRLDRMLPTASVVVLDRQWSAREWEGLDLVDDPRLRRAYGGRDTYSPGEYLTRSRPMLEDWHGSLRPTAQGGHPRGHALIRAAVDLARIGLTAPQPREFLEEVCLHYLGDAAEVRILRPESPDEAWEWATEQRYGVSSMLIPADTDLVLWKAFDYLVDADSEGEVSDAVWEAALDRADDDARHLIAQAAFDADRWDRAEAAWRPAAERGRGQAMHGLGRIAHDRGDFDTAEHWYHRGIDEAGDPRSLNGMGVLCSERLDKEGAECWYRRAIEEHDYATAKRNYGLELYEHHDLAAAEHWYREAIRGGETDAYDDLGLLHEIRGEVHLAVACFRKARAVGDPFGALHLGGLCRRAGLPESAEYWFTKAAEDRGPGGAAALEMVGNLRMERGTHRDATESFRAAADRGSDSAKAWLGVQCAVDGDGDTARAWFDRVLSAQRGKGAGARMIAAAFKERNRLGAALPWYRRAYEEGRRSVATELAQALVDLQEPAEAEDVLRRSTDAGEQSSFNELGVLLDRQGADAEAQAYFRKGVHAGEPWAMYNMANILRHRGHGAAADRLLRSAADNGHPGAAGELAENGDLTSDDKQRYVERAAHLGTGKAMLSLSRILRDRPGDFGESDLWCRRAAEKGLSSALMEMAKRAEERGDEEDAEAWLLRAAHGQTGVRAMFLLAKRARARGDAEEAEMWERRARTCVLAPISTVVEKARNK